MLISEFSDRISGSSAKVSKVNQHWFPKWIRRFSTFVDELPGGIDAVNFEAVGGRERGRSSKGEQ